MKTILQEMYDYHYGGNLQEADVTPRIKELERKARLVLENGCLLTVAELADLLTDFDDWNSCPFCQEDGKGEKDHDEDCPFSVAYQVLRPEYREPIPADSEVNAWAVDTKDQAINLALSLNLDDAIRTIAKTGKNHDGGPNYYAKFEQMEISATFGAGTNSASVIIADSGVLYSASDYGRHIDTFRPGPWVGRLIHKAGQIAVQNEATRLNQEADKARRKAEKFKAIDF